MWLLSVLVVEFGVVVWGCVRGRSVVDFFWCEVFGFIFLFFFNYCVVVIMVESFWVVGGLNEDVCDFFSVGELCCV